MNRFDPNSGNKQVYSTAISCQYIGAIDQSGHLVISNGHMSGAGCYDASNGAPQWTMGIPGFQQDIMLISDEKVIYGIVNEHHASRLPTKIVAVQSDARLANSGWPRPWHDNRNTGNWSK